MVGRARMLGMRANYHTHTDFCDGEASAAQMARAAAELGYDALGFSGHAPFPTWMTGAVQPESLVAYAQELRRLKEVWAGRMDVHLGLEVDWYPPEIRPGDGSFSSLGLEYIIGSTHFVEFDGIPAFSVDGPTEALEAGIAAAGGARRVYREYYRRLGDMIEDGGFDILGHFDLVRKNNASNRLFDEESRDYLDAAFEAAHRVKGRNIIVEINTGAMARGRRAEPYPSLALLREFRALGARITLDADAHAPAHLGPALRWAAKTLAEAAGYRSVAVLKEGLWVDADLE